MKKVSVGIIVSGVFLFLVVRQIDYNELAEAFSQVNYGVVVFSVLIHFLGFWLRTLRWKLLIARFKNIPISQLFPYLAIGYMANNVLFLRLGDIIRAHIAGKGEGISRSSMLGVILTERLFDGLTVVILFASLLAFLPLPESLKPGILIASLLFIVAAIGFFLLPILEKRRLIQGLYAWAQNHPKWARFYHSFQAFLTGLKTMDGFGKVVSVLTASLMIWGVEAVMFWMIGQSFGLHLSIAQSGLIALVVGFSTLIPSGPGYVGTFEFFFAQVAVFFGVDTNTAVSYAILTHFAQWFPITVVGFYFAWAKRISILKIGSENG